MTVAARIVGWQARRPQTRPPTRNGKMNALARWNQLRWNQLNEDTLSILFSHLQPRRVAPEEELLSVPDWTPLVDISEDGKEYLIETELPEVRKEDVKI